ncbi:hypothetical protein NOLU111490_02960 [Novosphingobium lubricantis]|jgi:DNA-binding CsgD family transcriptional regulator
MSETNDNDLLLGTLTRKQIEVLELVVDRRTNKEISGLLGISPSAVEQRLQSVRRHLGVTRRSDLARAYELIRNTSAKQTGAQFQVDEMARFQDFEGAGFGPGELFPVRDDERLDDERVAAQADPAGGGVSKEGKPSGELLGVVYALIFIASLALVISLVALIKYSELGK